jgi:hypothetical protein
MRRVGSKHREPLLNHRVLFRVVRMPICGHGRDHFVAGCSVVLEVGEPCSSHRHIALDVPPHVVEQASKPPVERAASAISRDGAAASKSRLRTNPIVWRNRRIDRGGLHRCGLGQLGSVEIGFGLPLVRET